MFRYLFASSILLAFVTTRVEAAPDRPNVVFIYADDIGYGDLSCDGATQVKTPNLDRLAREGLRHTDAHSASATCTPSRYALLTGEYAFRRKGTGVARGDASLIIEPERFSLARLFNQAGYATGVVGKWHLGLGEPGMDWNGPIRPGPKDLGFDEHFLIPATGDRVPCVYVENEKVAGLDPSDPIRVSFDGPVDPAAPTGKSNPELLLRMKPSHGHDMTVVNGISRIGYMTGGKKALWDDETMADVITGKAVDFLRRHSGEPFFLYFSTHDIHVPRVPHPRFAGKSGMGPRGDAILQLDDNVGQILKTIDDLRLTDKTIVMFSSDNGPVVDDGYIDRAVEDLGGHKPAGPFRGGKYSNFEGGTRVPLIVRWPEVVKPGSESNALVCQVDFLASFAKLLKTELPKNAGPDSNDALDALLGHDPIGREHLIEHAGQTSLRLGHWKFIPGSNGPAMSKATNTELGNARGPQLYDLSKDPGELTNLSGSEPSKVTEMRNTLDRIRNGEYLRPGFSR
jgi:arylsulfatase A-like enzyme